MWLSNPTPGHIPKENHNSKRYMHSNVHGSTIYNRKDMESNLNVPSTEEWKKKMWYIHTHNGISLSHKQEWNCAICRHVDGSRDCHTEWSKSEREKQVIIY